MVKLKEVIHQLNDEIYDVVENKLAKTKAENFLYVLRSLKEDKISEEQIKNNLSINANSYYVLKSRLYDRIQDNLTTAINLSKSDIYSQLEQVHSICYNSSHELALAFY
jgi:hypothetical protein